MSLAAILAWSGAAVAFLRLGGKNDVDAPVPASFPRVSILIPARNEARNLPPLLASLKTLDYPSYEVIVVDDGSTDGTADIAAAFGVRVLRGEPLPAGWSGKNWACHQAAAAATGELLLFTDADTVHRPDGLRRAVAFQSFRNADLVSALPFHRSLSIWEKLMGPFHALVLVATAYRSPRRRRLFAIGQFLLFRRSFYDRFGGHEAVAGFYPDDLALANRTIEVGGTFAFFAGTPFFDVRMYATLSEFIAGWRRNFSAGLRLGHWQGAAEVGVVVCALLAGGEPRAGVLTWLPAVAVLVLIAVRQRRWGDFSFAGILFYPFAVAVCLVTTVAGALDLIRGGAIRWRGRTLTDWARPENLS